MSKYSPTQLEELQRVGSYLRQQREERSIAIEDVAATTFVRPSLLSALEAGDSDRLPEAVYVQGFIRRYGDFLGLDGNELAHTLSRPPSLTAEQLTPEMVALPTDPTLKDSPSAAPRDKLAKTPKKTRSAQPVPLNNPSSPNPTSARFRPYWIFLVALGATIAGLYALFTRPAAPPVATPPASSPALSTANPVPPSQPTPANLPVQSTPPASSPLAAQVDLTADAWLKVEVDGKKVYEGVLRKGEQKTWTANESLHLRSGNAGAVNLSVNQQQAKPLGPTGKIADVTLTPTSQDF